MKSNSSAFSKMATKHKNVNHVQSREKIPQIEKNDVTSSIPKDMSFWNSIATECSEISLIGSDDTEESTFSFLQHPKYLQIFKNYTDTLKNNSYYKSIEKSIETSIENSLSLNQLRVDFFRSKDPSKKQNKSKENKSKKPNKGGVFDSSQTKDVRDVLEYWASMIKGMVEHSQDIDSKEVVSDTKEFREEEFREAVFYEKNIGSKLHLNFMAVSPVAQFFQNNISLSNLFLDRSKAEPKKQEGRERRVTREEPKNINYKNTKNPIKNIIDTLYEDHLISIYRIKGTTLYCIHTKVSYIWNCTYNSNYDDKKFVHINFLSQTEGSEMKIYDRFLRDSGICAFDLSVGNLGILFQNSMFHFSPEKESVQIFHLPQSLPKLRFSSSIQQHQDIPNTDNVNNDNVNNVDIPNLDRNIVPHFMLKEYEEWFSQRESLDIHFSSTNSETMKDVSFYIQKLIFWGDVLRHVPHKRSFSPFSPPKPNLFLQHYVAWREHLSPSSIVGLSLLLCEQLQNWIQSIKQIKSEDDLLRVLNERDRLSSLGFCMRKEMEFLLSLFSKGDALLQKKIDTMLYQRKDQTEIFEILNQNPRLYSTFTLEPYSYWNLAHISHSNFDEEEGDLSS